MPEVNLWAVLVAALVSVVLGGLWYSPMLFGKAWVKLQGWSDSQVKQMKNGAGKSYLLGVVTALVSAYVLSLIINMKEGATLNDGLTISLGVWLGFVATVQLGSVLWEGKKFQLFLLNTAYSLVSFLAMGAIISKWL
jgi:hypothetical protein